MQVLMMMLSEARAERDVVLVLRGGRERRVLGALRGEL